MTIHLKKSIFDSAGRVLSGPEAERKKVCDTGSTGTYRLSGPDYFRPADLCFVGKSVIITKK